MQIDNKTALTSKVLERRGRYVEMNLRGFSRVYGSAVNIEFLFEYARAFGSPLELKSNSVSVNFAFQLGLDFESHRYICTPASEVLRLH